jgi:hypothetical protein
LEEVGLGLHFTIHNSNAARPSGNFCAKLLEVDINSAIS